jgi:ABC-type Fe3+-hydroxamate transport system substrate-binding protein
MPCLTASSVRFVLALGLAAACCLGPVVSPAATVTDMSGKTVAVYTDGKGSFHTQVLELAGGVNVHPSPHNRICVPDRIGRLGQGAPDGSVGLTRPSRAPNINYDAARRP